NQYNGGSGIVDSRKIEGSFNHSNLSGNNAIQSDNVIQSQNISKSESDEAFDLLFEEIKKMQDESKKEQAEYIAEQLKEAFQNNDSTKGKKLIGFLKSSIGTVASLATIARFFGVTI